MATALELVNRVRRQLRWSDTASFTSAEDKAVLDAVNSSVAVIFERWDWECDIRHDGVLHTMKSRTDTGASVSESSTSVLWNEPSGLSDAYLDLAIENATHPIVYLVAQDDAQYGDTALRVSTLQTATVGLSVYTNAILEERFPGATNANATLQVVANTYVLPSTVRKVLRVRHQERDVALLEAERFHLFDRAVQRPHDSVTDNPDVVVMGGFETSTAWPSSIGFDGVEVDGSAVTGRSLTIWPTPSTELLLNYSYLRRHSDMTATTDTLSNVDRALEDLVVQLAYSRCVQNYVGDADAGTGMAIEQRVLGLASDLHSNQGKDPNRRRTMLSNFDERRYLTEVGRYPRNFGSN